MSKLVYKCDYCNMFSILESLVIAHETACVYNPKNKNCSSCKHFDMDIYMSIDCDMKVPDFYDRYDDNIQGCEQWEGE